jgi:dipeptidyl aminopeptidase/acylaminoacyl peptidase
VFGGAPGQRDHKETLMMRSVLWLALLAGVVSSAAAQQRPYRIDDYFSTEEVSASSVTVGPSGEAVAFTKLRAANTQLANSLVIPETRGDIWLQDAPGRPARNLTNGLADSSGWWAPQWSPDGQWLAFLSSRGGEVRVWGWERARQQLRQLSPSGVDFTERGGCRWVDARRLLCLVLPEGERSTPLGPGGYVIGKAVERAEAAWAGAKRGELTASAVHSLEFKLPQRRLLLVDVGTGTGQVVATTQSIDMHGLPNWWLSPAAQAVAFVRPSAVTYAGVQRQSMGYPAAIDLRRLDGRPLRLSQALPTNVVTSTLQWSPDGQALAFFALGDAVVHPELLYGEGAREVRYPAVASKEYPGQLWRVNLARGTVERLQTGDIDLGQGATPPAFLWTAAGELLFHAPHLVQGARPLTPSASAWVVLGRDGRTRALVPGGQQLPNALEPLDGGAVFVGLIDGEVWRVDPAKGTAKNLTARVAPRVHRMSPAAGAQPTTHLVVSSVQTPRTAWETMRVSQGRGVEYLSDYSLLHLASGATTPLRAPRPRAAVVAYHGVSQSALWHADDRDGAFLWRSTGIRPVDSLVATNRFLKDAVLGEQRTIEYTTLNGERMQAKLTLPVGYQQGRRYPLVVDFDIGYTADGSSHYAAADPSTLPSPYEEPFAAAGYVYMFASWPTTSMDPVGRSNLLLGPNGVIPAVEEVIRLGIADPERLFLYGASSAGYGVFALVTQTSRFKAAAAHAGWTDQITMRLTTTIHSRYTENPFDIAMMGANYSTSRLPSWRNGEHYRRNSPLSYVDRVQTPLLILHGDFDEVPITEPELFFKALVMQRKPAQFVRYWGEGHAINTPANLRDYFQRIFAWYDQWGDIARDTAGHLVFEGNRVKSRGGAPPLPADAYARFGPTAPAADRPLGPTARGTGRSGSH